MTDKLKKDQNENKPMDEDQSQAFSDQDQSMPVDEDSGDVNAKGGATTDEGMEDYEIGYYEATGVLDEDDDTDTWEESTSGQTNTPRRTPQEDEL